MARLLDLDLSPAVQKLPSDPAEILPGRVASYVWPIGEGPRAQSLTDEVVGEELVGEGGYLLDRRGPGGAVAAEAGADSGDRFALADVLDTEEPILLRVVVRATGNVFVLRQDDGVRDLRARLEGSVTRIRLRLDDGDSASSAIVDGSFGDGGWHLVIVQLDRAADRIAVETDFGSDVDEHTDDRVTNAADALILRGGGPSAVEPAQMAHASLFLGDEAKEAVQDFGWTHGRIPDALTTHDRSGAVSLLVGEDGLGPIEGIWSEHQFATARIAGTDGLASWREATNLLEESHRIDNWFSPEGGTLSTEADDLADSLRRMRECPLFTATEDGAFIESTSISLEADTEYAITGFVKKRVAGVVTGRIELFDRGVEEVIAFAPFEINEDGWFGRFEASGMSRDTSGAISSRIAVHLDHEGDAISVDHLGLWVGVPPSLPVLGVRTYGTSEISGAPSYGADIDGGFPFDKGTVNIGVVCHKTAPDQLTKLWRQSHEGGEYALEVRTDGRARLKIEDVNGNLVQNIISDVFDWAIPREVKTTWSSAGAAILSVGGTSYAGSPVSWAFGDQDGSVVIAEGWSGITTTLSTDDQADIDTFDIHVGLQTQIVASLLKVGASANYSSDGNMVDVAFYILDEEQDLLVPNNLKGKATAKLLYNGHTQVSAVFSKDNANDDGAIRLSFMNPPVNEDMIVEILADVAGLGSVVTSSDVLHHEDDYSLSEIVHTPTDPQQPRIERDPITRTKQLDKDESQEVVEDKRTLFELNTLSSFDPLIEGIEYSYSGGGNRYLPTIDDEDTVLALQQKDVFPSTVGMRVFLEGSSENLIPDADFLHSEFPSTIDLDFPSTISVESDIVGFNDTSNQLRLHMRGLGHSYTGPKLVSLTSDFIPVNSSSPVAFSALLRTSIRSGPVKTLKLVLQWYSGSGSELSEDTVTFDPVDFDVNEPVQADMSVIPPIDAASVRWRLEIGSIDGSNDVRLFVALPQLEQNPFPTTRTIGTRDSDFLTAPQHNQFSSKEGTVTIQYAPLYDGKPNNDVVLFDSRNHNALNGYVAKHQADGRLSLAVYDNQGEQVVIESDEVILMQGDPKSVSFSWGESILKVFDSDTLLTESSDNYSSPSQENLFSIGSSINGEDNLYGELISVRVTNTVR